MLSRSRKPQTADSRYGNFPESRRSWKGNLTDGGHCRTRDYAMEWTRLGHNVDLDNPIWLNVFKNRMFRELPPLIRTQLSLTSFMMGLQIRGYRHSFGTKSGWSLLSKLMGTSDHFRYSGVAGETSMTSWVVSFYFLLDS
jgi:hypothetical protein